MDTDRELLVLAARAAGMKLVYAPDDGPCRGCQFIDGKSAAWNPLADDGDALRLAVRLRIDFYEGDDDGPAAYAGYFVRGIARQRFATERHNSDKYAATRRAIVRAAAEIGKAMP
jgi:hypothetical protein